MIIATILAGPAAPPMIGQALKGADYAADVNLVIETTPDRSEALRAGLGETDILQRWPWCDDYAAARNASLDIAGKHPGASWMMMVDPDETVICPDPAALRAFLAALPPEVDMVLAFHRDGSHTRERLFRLPQRNRFVGRTHETIGGNKVLAPRDLIVWDELPKTPEQLRAKFTRDADMLRADIADDPKNGAAHYYLGETLQSLGHHEEAIEHFRQHNALATWEEGRAWACFKAAESYFALGQPYRVLECAAQGLVHDAGMAELYWIAAVACWAEAAKVCEAQGDARKAWEWVEQARCWGEVARVHGAGSKAEGRRVGKRDLRGLGPGVDEVLAAVRALGEPR